jgi:energy-coupling factor transporter ATP-binding protein EcfA2|uniref:DNA replication and repair protein RecF n=1 Tax=Candidatus Methanogaster sp. ANME-2c ERB4 TaxID=2759911 RepID=A0A7G9Y920_9EURY|nr:DNA replication and repair protein RecF [Methanosarcinales archaeon ANME-2c ERB4]QNO45003.1 DNA replication and repair protein RecF [Methanosarcinales archaeon ANME-2c ERB4]QNO45139.1 DNA replication and repair protein RecF [Methanosarcinales archaeon ANME-2c ERB4]
MRFVDFKIKNFKGIKQLTINFDNIPEPKIYTLVGLNESGKTSILEAIDFFGNGQDVKDVHLLIPKSKISNFNDDISVKATISLDDVDINQIKDYAFDNLNFGITNDDFATISITKKLSFKDSKFDGINDLWSIELVGKEKGNRKKPRKLEDEDALWSGIVKYIKTEMIPRIIYYPNFLFDIPEKIYLEKQPNEGTEQPFYRNILQDVLDSLNNNLDLNRHIVDRLKSSDELDKEALDATIERMSGKMTSVIFKAWQEIFKRDIHKEISLNTGNDGGKPFIEIKIKEGIEKYQVKERSLGFRWFFTFLLFTEFRKNRSDDPGETLFLLDEPAYNLHSTAQKILLTNFEKLATNSRLIYTTHSHHLINPMWLSGTYIVENKALNYEDDSDFDRSKTDVDATLYKNFVAASPDKKTYFQPILDSLEYQPSLLELVPDITVFEGKNDYYTFKYINDVLMSGKYSDLHIYPGQGASSHNKILSLYIAWGRNIIVMLDGDKPGKKEKKNYEKRFGPIVDDKIFTLEDVDPSLKNTKTEDIFTSDEKIAIIQTLFGDENSYSKSKFNTAIEHLYISKTSVELSEDTAQKFNKIFEFIKSKQER